MLLVFQKLHDIFHKRVRNHEANDQDGSTAEHHCHDPCTLDADHMCFPDKFKGIICKVLV